jgi:hypothetical protein
MIPVSSNQSGEATLKGYIGAGVYLEVGCDFVHTRKADIANINLRGEAGVKLEGNLVLDKNDTEQAKKNTAIYEQLRDSEVSLDWFYGVSASAQFWKWMVSREVNLGNIKLNNQGRIVSYSLAPTFSDVKAKWASENNSVINAQATVGTPQTLLGGKSIAVDAGLAIVDEDGDIVSRSYEVSDYRGGQKKTFEHNFGNLSSDGKYTIYPCIKWMGCDLLASPSAEPQLDNCPDSNHPHMIDLGLPSGTKWACCNVGAHTPEEYGGYYAWGETQTKSYYDPSTYSYWHDSDGDNYQDRNELTNIGSDIAGTSYDAATANWGAPWRMPSRAQVQELLNNCSIRWTQQNGVNGRLFTGSNGGTIFLPAAGDRWGAELSGEGSTGRYWSSSLGEGTPDDAYYLYFNSGNAACWNFNGRICGYTVRPVRKN